MSFLNGIMVDFTCKYVYNNQKLSNTNDMFMKTLCLYLLMGDTSMFKY